MVGLGRWWPVLWMTTLGLVRIFGSAGEQNFPKSSFWFLSLHGARLHLQRCDDTGDQDQVLNYTQLILPNCWLRCNSPQPCSFLMRVTHSQHIILWPHAYGLRYQNLLLIWNQSHKNVNLLISYLAQFSLCSSLCLKSCSQLLGGRDHIFCFSCTSFLSV